MHLKCQFYLFFFTKFLLKEMKPIEHNGPDFHYELKWRKYDAEEEGEDGDAWTKIIIEDWQKVRKLNVIVKY